MAAIFAVGAGVGLAGAWWFNPGFLDQRPAALNPAAARVAAPAVKRPGPNEQTSVARGVGASELPYDGAPPTAAGSTRTDPAVESLNSSGAGANPESRRDSGAPAQPALPSPQARVGPQLKEEAPAEAASVSKAPERPAEKAMAQPGPREPKVAKLAPKRRAAPKVAKNREIDRIRQQAEEELKKKPANLSRQPGTAKSGSAARRSPVAASEKAQTVRSMLVRCDRIANIFRREQCKWRLCGGMWGKNGCPSYATASNSY
jgi:hypothetical protein